MAAESVGQIGLDLVVNQNQFKNQMSGITGLAKKAGVALAGAFAVKKLVEFGKECTELGSKLAEVDNVIQQAVPSMEGKIDTFSKNAIQQFGMSETAAKKFTGVFASMSRSFGFNEQQAADMGTSLTALAADVASFYDTSQDEAFTKLKSVFTGETETLKDLGVVMTQSALDAYAMANGYNKTTKEMSEAEKVALRYAFVQEKLRFAAGDFARTSDSWANQVRILSEQFNALKASIGQGLINVLAPVLKVINMIVGKLVQLATAFKGFTELLTGKKSQSGSGGSGGALSGIEDGASGIEETAGAADNLADSTSGVGTAAKKAAKEMRSLMGFDQINKMSDPADDSDSGGGGGSGKGAGAGGVGAMDFGGLAEGETVLDKMSGDMSAFIKRCKELANLFKSGFWDGLGDYKPRLEELKKDFASIGKHLQEIATDKDVQIAVQRFADKFAYNVGRNLGAMVSVGLTIATNIVGGIESFLDNSKDRIKRDIIKLFDIGSAIMDLGGDFSEAFADVFSVFASQNAQNITGNIISVFYEVFALVEEIALSAFRDITSFITRPFVENKDAIKTALMETLEPLESVTNTIKTFVQGVGDRIREIYDGHIKPFIDSLTEGVTEIVGILVDGYITHIAPVLDQLAAKFDEVMNGPVGTALDSIQTAIIKVIDALKRLWEEALQPFIAWIAENIMPVLSDVLLNSGTLFMDFLGTIGTVVSGIFDALGSLIDFLVGVFTGDWDKALEGLKGIGEGFKKAIEAVFNFIKDSILKPFDDFLSGVFATDWSRSFGVFGDVLNGFFKNLSNIWDSIKKIFSGIIDFVSGVFTGNWKKAWQGVKDIFSGVWDGLAAVLKSPINAIIGIMNGLIRGVASAVNGIADMLNNLRIDIPDWVPGIGGGTLGFNVPKWSPGSIPYLAQGGFVKANTPRLAVIGDNRHHGEIVAPEDKMQAMVDAAVARAAGTGGLTRDDMASIMNNVVMRIVAALSEMGFYLDGEQMARAEAVAQSAIDRRWNGVEVK
ncbi:phage-related protein [Aequitasia blattaphilus]|uniref:Phage-related protein n=1 Tax=Aequitasia blattaphilus TaxID=2949332 RepID=A0ABT1ECN2_9FIRM|nr:hypothetical protein [Aequitasia blattaphilus]MCP1103595.1 hypothetical protein [Aequitasia blattaphilus]MCR8616235.1 hypothetical protein [Aequitasia blattaphilus]